MIIFFKGKQHKQETVSVREASDQFSLFVSCRSSSADKVQEAEPRVYCLVLSSFSSSMSLREALTLLETSFPWEKRRWRSLKVRLSGASLGIEFSCSWLQHTRCRLKLYIHIVPTVTKQWLSLAFCTCDLFHSKTSGQKKKKDVLPHKSGLLLLRLTSSSICLVGPCGPLILQLLLSFQCTS